MTNKITLRDLYNAIGDLEKKIDGRIIRLEKEVDVNTGFRNQLIGKITVIFAIIGVGVNWIWDYFVNNT